MRGTVGGREAPTLHPKASLLYFIGISSCWWVFIHILIQHQDHQTKPEWWGWRVSLESSSDPKLCILLNSSFTVSQMDINKVELLFGLNLSQLSSKTGFKRMFLTFELELNPYSGTDVSCLKQLKHICRNSVSTSCNLTPANSFRALCPAIIPAVYTFTCTENLKHAGAVFTPQMVLCKNAFFFLCSKYRHEWLERLCLEWPADMNSNNSPSMTIFRLHPVIYFFIVFTLFIHQQALCT